MDIFKLRKKVEDKDVGDVVADIDAIDVKPTSFRWNGGIHKLKPVTTKQFFVITQALAHLDSLGKKPDLKADDLVEAYGTLIEATCDTIKKKDVMNMTQAQVAALFQLIIQHVTGKAQVDEKKT